MMRAKMFILKLSQSLSFGSPAFALEPLHRNDVYLNRIACTLPPIMRGTLSDDIRTFDLLTCAPFSVVSHGVV